MFDERNRSRAERWDPSATFSRLRMTDFK